ncbi:energy transducer TonB [Anaerosinus massiliensis]|uniref:energy transducer TonB n=1 Tax=Massilibacillus massiliensis TaxID=1806837 RepID=UPI000DA617CB|nr:energy transducer TonB [Massilibacillus massiliensis]
MSYTLKWRKAMLASLLCHLIVLPILGYFTATLTVVPPEDEENFIEMTLETSTANAAAASSTQAPQSMSTPLTEPMTPDTPVSPTEDPAPALAPKVITTNSLTMLDAEVSPAPSSRTGTSAAKASSESAGGTSSGIPVGGGQGNDDGAPAPSGTAKPSILEKSEPDYPTVARQNNWQGTVELKVQILTNGRTGRISVSSSSGYSVLDDAAVEAMRQWIFTPARDLSTNQAVACTINYPMRFRLN